MPFKFNPFTGNLDFYEADTGTVSPLTTKGDVYTYDSSDARLAVGANGTVLTADSTQSTGIKWAIASGSGDVTAAANMTDNAVVRGDGGAKGVQDSLVVIDDSDHVSGVASLTLNTGGALRTDTSNTNTALLQAYDVDGTSYTTFGTLKAGNTPTFDLSTATTIGTNAFYYASGTDVPISDGGTGSSTASGARTNLGVAIGSDVQAYDAQLADIAALAVTDSNFIVGDGANWVAETGATARTSMGLGSIATQASNSVSITGGSVTGITDIVVADGGNGRSSATAYAVLCGGTTTTAAHQSIASVGTSAQVLTSNGAGALPTFQAAAGGSSPLTTKGDLYTYDSADARLAIGTNDNCLIADSAAATGNKWGVLQEVGGGTGQSTYTTGDLLYSDASNSLSKLPAASDGAILSYFGGIPVALEPKNYFWHYDDFVDDGAIVKSNSGSGSAVANDGGGSGQPGVFRIETGTTTTGKAAILLDSVKPVRMTGGEFSLEIGFQVSQLSTASQEFLTTAGFSNQNAGGTLTEGAYFKYDRTTSVNWQYGTMASSTESISTSSTAVDTNYHRFNVVVNSGATSVEFFIDDVSIGTQTTNIPSNVTSVGVRIEKTAGTTEVKAKLDYWRAIQKFSSSRY